MMTGSDSFVEVSASVVEAWSVDTVGEAVAGAASVEAASVVVVVVGEVVAVEEVVAVAAVGKESLQSWFVVRKAGYFRHSETVPLNHQRLSR